VTVEKTELKRQAFLFAVIAASGAIGFALPLLGGRLTLPILPSGIAVAAAYRFGRRTWPSIFAAGVAIDLMAREPLVAALGVGMGLAAGALATSWLLNRQGFDADFSRAVDVPRFVLAAVLGMSLAPAFGIAAYAIAGAPLGGPAHIQAIRWWANVVVGVLLVSPILMGNRAQHFRRLAGQRKSAAGWIVALLICCGSVFLAPESIGRPITLVLAVTAVMVGSMEFGLAVAAAGALSMCAAAAASLTFESGIFGQLPPLVGLVTLWCLAAVLTGLNFITTALLAERDAASRQRLNAEHRYALIFEGSPQPMWVHDRETMTFLLVNAAVERQYGWSAEELLTRSIEILTPPGEPRLLAHGQPRDQEVQPFETRHLTKDGRVLDVEIWSRSMEFEGRPAELVFAVDVTERRAFGQALVEAVTGEQRRIAQEMHDGLGQELTGLALSMRALANLAEKQRDTIAAVLDDLARLVTGCIKETHRIVAGLSPLTDAEDHLDLALTGLAERSALSGVDVRFTMNLPRMFECELKVRHHLYRIAQEAVQNALKHSGAKSVEISLSSSARGVALSITDDGRGFSSEGALGLGLGMRTMRFRANAVGGQLTVSHRPNCHSVICELPMHS